MPTYICQHRGHWFLWSTVTDTPTTSAMTEDEMRAMMVRHTSCAVDEDLAEEQVRRRMERAKHKGTSSRIHDSLAALVCFNRYGPRGGSMKFRGLMRKIGIPEEARHAEDAAGG